MRTNVKEKAELTPKQQQAALLLAEGKTGRAVAETMGVDEVTVSRWKAAPAFEALINRCLADAHEATRYRLRTVATKAVDVVEGVLDDQDADPKDRLNAAFSMLKLLEATSLFKTGEPIGPTDAQTVEAKRQSDATFEALSYL